MKIGSQKSVTIVLDTDFEFALVVENNDISVQVGFSKRRKVGMCVRAVRKGSGI